MNRVKELIKKNEKNGKEISKLLNIPYPTLTNYSTNNRQPETENAVKLANYFNVSIDYLMGYVDDPGSRIVTNEELSSVIVIGYDEMNKILLAYDAIENNISKIKADVYLTEMLSLPATLKEDGVWVIRNGRFEPYYL